MSSYREESLDPLLMAEGMVGMVRQTTTTGRPDLDPTFRLR